LSKTLKKPLAATRKAAGLMAKIEEKIKNGKIVSFKFKAFLGRDENKKQIFRCMTWTPPEGLTLAKSRKAAKQAAEDWEEEARREYQTERESVSQRFTGDVEGVHYTFDSFVNDVWLPLYLLDGSHRPNTLTAE
jgi:hypothetical protein